MKVAIPTEGKRGMEEQVSHHFGRAPTYTLVDTEAGAVEIIDNTSEHMGGTGLPPELLHAKGAEAILCANLGHNAIEMFNQRGITAYVGAHGTVKDILAAWKEGHLRRATEETSCKDGRHHEHHVEHHLHKH
jgi:predicted Fe-Mo cluster-binding NifX family protein